MVWLTLILAYGMFLLYCVRTLKKWTSLWYCDETNEDNLDKIFARQFSNFNKKSVNPSWINTPILS